MLLFNPLAWGAVLIFSVIGVAFSMPSFYLGKKGMDEVKHKYPNLGPERFDQITRLHQRWRAFIMLLTAFPVLGTVLPAAAGATGARLGHYPFLNFANGVRL